jgi:hypothetical protein
MSVDQQRALALAPARVKMQGPTAAAASQPGIVDRTIQGAKNFGNHLKTDYNLELLKSFLIVHQLWLGH